MKLINGAMATLIVAVVGWMLVSNSRLSAVESTVSANTERIQRLDDSAQRDRDSAAALMREIVQRLARIEGKLDRR